MGSYVLGFGRPIVVLMALVLFASATRPTSATTAVTVGGPFELTTPQGATVTNQTYRGKWLLVYFGYTSCPDSCPTALLEMAATLQRLGHDAIEVQPIFITVDPQRDTPKVMGDYARSFDSRIAALTGSQDAIDAVTRVYGAYAVRKVIGSGSDYLVDHSVYIYLMSPLGEFVRAFDTHSSADEIASAIRGATARSSEQAFDRSAQTRD